MLGEARGGLECRVGVKYPLVNGHSTNVGSSTARALRSTGASFEFVRIELLELLLLLFAQTLEDRALDRIIGR